MSLEFLQVRIQPELATRQTRCSRCRKVMIIHAGTVHMALVVVQVEGEALPACVDRLQARDMGMANGRRWWLLDASSIMRCRP